VTDDRSLTAELLYYMRGEPTPVLAWRSGPKPNDHFELTRPYVGETTGRTLLVTLGGDVTVGSVASDKLGVHRAFEQSELIGVRKLSTGRSSTRNVTFIALTGYRGR
jgi:hypothetical protein